MTQDKLQKGNHVDAPKHNLYGVTVMSVNRGIARLKIYNAREGSIVRKIPVADCEKITKSRWEKSQNYKEMLQTFEDRIDAIAEKHPNLICKSLQDGGGKLP